MSSPTFEEQTTRSSFNHLFLVVSSKQIVEQIAVPNEHTFRSLLGYCRNCYITNSPNRYVPLEYDKIIFDAEGEMLGFGGVMKIMTFMFFNRRDIPGLVIDMTCEESMKLARDILLCDQLQKIVWGGESDFSSMMHQRLPFSLNIVPANVIDIQKMFTEKVKYALSMKKALAQIQLHNPGLLDGLPSKDIINWDESYSRNKEALPFPLNETHLKYSVDDLHRIEIIANTMYSNYNVMYVDQKVSEQMTDADIARVRKDVYGREWFYRQVSSYKKAKRLVKPVVQLLAKAVPIQRHITYLQTKYGNALHRHLSPSDCRTVALYDTEFTTLLATHNVVIQQDLSFNP